MKRMACCSVLMLAAVACAHAQSGSAANPPFTITISPLQPTVKLGQPAMIHIVLKSNTQGQLTLSEERNSGNAELNYSISVQTADGLLVPDTEFGAKLKAHIAAVSHSSSMIKYLDYGEEVAENADLNTVVRIKVPGDYAVQVERYSDQYVPLHIKSNKIVIHVEP